MRNEVQLLLHKAQESQQAARLLNKEGYSDFAGPASKTAFLAITENLLKQLEQMEGITVSVRVRGDAPR